MTARRIILISFIGLVVLSVFGYLAVANTRARWVVRTTSQLRQIHQSALTAANASGTLPPTIAALIWDEYLSHDVFFTYRSKRSPADVQIGNTTLKHLLDLSWQEASDVVFSLPQPDLEWELVGDFLLSRRIGQLNETSQTLVVGVSSSCPCAEDLRIIVHADNSVETVDGTAWISQQNKRRSHLGLPALPQLP